MIVGFHYHVPILVKDNGRYYTSGAIGVFIDSIAEQCDELICFSHTALFSEISQMDYALNQKNITVVEIGPHDLFLKRIARSRVTFKKIQPYMQSLDLMLIRGPSPLLPLFSSTAIKQNIPLSYLLVGDYVKSFEGANVKGMKKFILTHYYNYNKRMQDKYAKKALVFVNSRVLYDEYRTLSSDIHEVKTTTLIEEDFFKKDKIKFHDPIQLLYTGRIEPAKGLDEVLDAMKVLYKEGIETRLNLVGWEDKRGYMDHLFQKAKNNGLEKSIVFHGKKQVGEELFSMYRNADIYIIASKGNEGFPRTIWEAMANSLPVIASNIGSIPYFLEDNENVLLVEPGSVNELVSQIEKLINNHELVKKLVKNAYEKAENNTLDKQASKMILISEKYIDGLSK